MQTFAVVSYLSRYAIGQAFTVLTPMLICLDLKKKRHPAILQNVLFSEHKKTFHFKVIGFYIKLCKKKKKKCIIIY